MSDTKAKWPALSQADKEFISFWEKERDRRKKWSYLLFHNLRMGTLFGAPIAIFFMAEAPRHRSLITHTDLTIIMICIVLIIVFYAFFRGYSKWDKSNSRYEILKMREKGNSGMAIPSKDKKSFEN